MLCKPFDTYIAECSDWIKQRRATFSYEIPNVAQETIITANSPFELKPHRAAGQTGKFRYGALLIHGLLDCPFSLRDLGTQCQQAGILTRAVLLPGHGTHPTDLLSTTWQDWLTTVNYGVEALRQEVDKLFLVGYSTGGTLSIYHALNNSNIDGIILLAPALKILPPVSTIIRWPVLANFFSDENKWLSKEKENNYTKYESVPFHPVIELGRLIKAVGDAKNKLTCPMMIVMSQDDETVSATETLKFFENQLNDANKFILYSNKNTHFNSNIETRQSAYPELNIKDISHVGLPFSPNNPHYGQEGDYPDHCQPAVPNMVYGAYNRAEIKIYDQLYKLKLIKNRRQTLSYNPDFNYMSDAIVKWISSLSFAS